MKNNHRSSGSQRQSSPLASLYDNVTKLIAFVLIWEENNVFEKKIYHNDFNCLALVFDAGFSGECFIIEKFLGSIISCSEIKRRAFQADSLWLYQLFDSHIPGRMGLRSVLPGKRKRQKRTVLWLNLRRTFSLVFVPRHIFRSQSACCLYLAHECCLLHRDCCH